MGAEPLYLRQARKQIADFARESTAATEHEQALERIDCDAVLKLGIDAFEWLIQADLYYRNALYDGLREHDPDVEKDFASLFQEWLRPCRFANAWIAKVTAGGYDLDHLAKFRHCEAEVQGIVRFLTAENDALTEPVRTLRDAAIQEHDNGKTAEFF